MPAGSAFTARDAAELSAWAALDGLDVGILLLTLDLRVSFANARWTEWHGAPIPLGTGAAALMDETDALDAMRATVADGEPRPLSLTLRPAQADLHVRRLFGSVRRGGAGLVIEARAEAEDDRIALHDVARRLAEVNDMAEVLRTLCDIASRQCTGTGAAVLRTTSGMAEIIAASGDLSVARGRCFEAHGSLLEESISRGRCWRSPSRAARSWPRRTSARPDGR
jgi:hypothetical protein